MVFPLYRGVELPAQAKNKGLLFDKFYQWDNLGEDLKKQDKRKNLEKFTGRCGDEDALKSAARRHCELIEALKGKFKVFSNEWHAIFGMGSDHPLENGMAWHPTLGVPYLAGSGVKGLVRAYCEVWQGWDKEKIVRCFGAESGSDAGEKAGEYIFFDALPVKTPELTADVMTPHMGKWYENGNAGTHTYENAPGDWHAPVPVLFLAVKRIHLVFGIAPRHEFDTDELEELWTALEEALQWIGAGAKTAVGYGHFVVDDFENSKIQRIFKERREKEERERIELENKERLAKLSPVDRILEEYQNDIPTVIRKMQNEEIDNYDQIKVQLAKKIKEILMQSPKTWEKASKKALKRKEFIQSILGE